VRAAAYARVSTERQERQQIIDSQLSALRAWAEAEGRELSDRHVFRDEGHSLRLRHDHGSQYVSHHFRAEIRFLGVESSPAFVREPEGNGCAERFIRTLKENLLWVRRFETVEELRLALQQFRQTYNRSWIIERHGYKTPAQVRADQLGQLPMAA
jgi:transposase InsO family protein